MPEDMAKESPSLIESDVSGLVSAVGEALELALKSDQEFMDQFKEVPVTFSGSISEDGTMTFECNGVTAEITPDMLSGGDNEAMEPMPEEMMQPAQ